MSYGIQKFKIDFISKYVEQGKLIMLICKINMKS